MATLNVEVSDEFYTIMELFKEKIIEGKFVKLEYDYIRNWLVLLVGSEIVATFAGIRKVTKE